ncbi:serine protease 57 [Hylobates moloch]|uniref:serine protease 57 n=1 Tax=Hylobates moloch TaxID=81572 RepID=UPI001363D2AC|nr:serine protease 57 [Hylobates moloch]
MGPGLGGWGRPLLTVATTLMLPMKLPGSWGAQIIGGHEVTPHSRPYMASVRFGGQHHCGGFLLQARWVVSAAHCFGHRDLRTGLVVLGAHALRTAEPTQQVFGIDAVTTHPNYHPMTHANDICLLRVSPGVASVHGDNGALGQDDGPADGSVYLLGALNTQTNVAIVVPSGNRRLEPGALAGVGLRPHRNNLQNLILERGPQGKVNDLRCLDGQGEEQTSSGDVVFMSVTRRPSLVTGVCSSSSVLPL